VTSKNVGHRWVKGHPGYHRWRAVEDRFWEKVAWTLEGWATRESPCWTWLASAGASGYGQFMLGGHKGTPGVAHRIAYELEIGPVPDGLTLDHLCRNKLCVNPWHLEPVPLAENIRRAFAAKALAGSQA
jgi:HNH endonuclease